MSIDDKVVGERANITSHTTHDMYKKLIQSYTNRLTGNYLIDYTVIRSIKIFKNRYPVLKKSVN
jgi:hypothetical protein